MSIRMSPKRSRTSSLLTRSTLITTSFASTLGFKRGSVNLAAAPSGGALWWR